MVENNAIIVTNLSKKFSINKDKIGISIFQRIKDIFIPKKKIANPKKFFALQDINFKIRQGEAVGIIGRNGAGKSTLLKILSQVTSPTTGTIEINGNIASVLEIGMGFHPELTGRENIYLSATMLGISKKKIDERFDEIVNFSGVHKFIDQPVKHYSSGMYVRLAFSVVINIDADILLFDEVLSVGDLSFQMQCIKKINELIQKNKTVLLVSHNLNDIAQLCSRIIYLENGRISEVKDTEIISDYYEKSLSEQTSLTDIQNKKFNNITYKEWGEDSQPGDKTMKIRKFYIQKQAQEDDIYFSNKKIVLNIEYEKYNDTDIFDFGVIISSLNAPFMACQSMVSDLNLNDYYESGIYNASLILNQDFFNETIIKFGFSVVKNSENLICFEYDVLSIKINLFLDDKQKFYYKNIRMFLGPIRAKSNWEIRKLNK